MHCYDDINKIIITVMWNFKYNIIIRCVLYCNHNYQSLHRAIEAIYVLDESFSLTYFFFIDIQLITLSFVILYVVLPYVKLKSVSRDL